MNYSLRKIAKINGYNVKENEFSTIERKSEVNKIDHSISLLKALKEKIYRRNILILWFIYVVSYTSYYVLSYYIGKFPGNLFINAFALMFADVAANLSVNIFIKWFGIKRSFTLTYFVITTAAIWFSFLAIFQN